MSKFWVKTNMLYGEEIFIFGQSWARLHFVENPGMAFGITFWGNTGKLLLSIFRIVAITGLFLYMAQLVRRKVSWGILFSFAMILAGAIGNILDSAFYGLIFSASHHGSGLAEFMPAEGGYGSFLFGKVVDMLYFPLFNTVLPDWLPFWGGKPFQFFRPVFNVADSAIFIGVTYLLLFHRSFFSNHEQENEATEASKVDIAPENTPEKLSDEGTIQW